MSKEIIKIEDLGWDDFFQSKRIQLQLDDLSVARVITERKGSYVVKNANGEFLAKITGKQVFEARSREDFPAVGDWVAIAELDNQQAVIKAVMPRKSIIKRKFGDKNKVGDKSDVQIIATNIDVAFLVQSVGRDYSLNRFERYLSLVRDAKIKPVILINKVDLISVHELDSKFSETQDRLGDIDIISTSTVTGKGIEKLKGLIEKGNTYCFLGSSGVGKSSLINKLLETKLIKTEDVSSHSNRGKHVTTAREMYFLSGGGIVIDNPGVREVGLADVDDGINSSFDEIFLLSKKCKYSDCTHTHEPGCEILAALKDGSLEEDQYSNYIELKNEAEFHAMNKHEKKEKNRQFGKFMKNAKKDFKKFKLKDF